MRWRATKPPMPHHKEERVRLVFAWRPTVVGDSVVWLERYEVHEWFFQPASGAPGWWSETKTATYNPCYY